MNIKGFNKLNKNIFKRIATLLEPFGIIFVKANVFLHFILFRLDFKLSLFTILFETNY